MTVIDLDAIDRTPVEHDPFDFFVVRNCIGREVLTAINQDYPEIEGPGNPSVRQVEYGPAFGDLLDAVQSPEFAESMGRKFCVDLDPSATATTVRKYCEKSDGNIHTDHRSKIVTVIMYFNEEWVVEEGRLRLLRRDRDLEHYAAEVSPLSGTLLAFLRSDHSWHGHKSFEGERRMLQLSYLRTDPLVRLRRRIDRLATLTMKKAVPLFSTRD
ncbi:MAG: 2OG-Fe(II) oxygenase [Pseudomonadales bacterium]